MEFVPLKKRKRPVHVVYLDIARVNDTKYINHLKELLHKLLLTENIVYIVSAFDREFTSNYMKNIVGRDKNIQIVKSQKKAVLPLNKLLNDFHKIYEIQNSKLEVYGVSDRNLKSLLRQTGYIDLIPDMQKTLLLSTTTKTIPQKKNQKQVVADNKPSQTKPIVVSSKGVSYKTTKCAKPYYARITQNKKTRYLGSFYTEKQAHQAYLKARGQML